MHNIFPISIILIMSVLPFFYLFGTIEKNVFWGMTAGYLVCFLCLLITGNALIGLICGICVFSLRILLCEQKSFGLRKAALKKAVVVGSFNNGKGRVMTCGRLYFAVADENDLPESGEIVGITLLGNETCYVRRISLGK